LPTAARIFGTKQTLYYVTALIQYLTTTAGRRKIGTARLYATNYVEQSAPLTDWPSITGGLLPTVYSVQLAVCLPVMPSDGF